MLGEDTISSPIKINIAECFNDYFVNVGPAMASSTDSCQTNFERYHNKVDNTLFAFQTISYSKVFKLLEKLIVSKATGIDKIPARILKIAAPVITNSIAKIFNCSIESGEFPLDWKIARVTPLHKKEPRNLLDNYRPTIFSTVDKVFEKILYEQFYDYLSTNNLLSKHQFGFRHFHSTMLTLLDCTNEWYYINMDSGLYNLVAFLEQRRLIYSRSRLTIS